MTWRIGGLEVRHKSINMEPAIAHRDAERPHWDFFTSIPELDRDLLPHDTVKGAQALQPLFEFSGACSGCGETPYLKLLTQLFGDRIVVASGLKPGEEIVTAGLFRLQDGAPVIVNNSIIPENELTPTPADS